MAQRFRVVKVGKGWSVVDSQRGTVTGPFDSKAAAESNAERQRKVYGVNPPQQFVPEEGPAEHIRNALQILVNGQDIRGYHQDACYEREDFVAIVARLEKALSLLENKRVYTGLPRKPNRRSVRRASNPALAVLGNPRVDDATIATWAKIEYMRPDDPDGDDVVRVHEFKDGFEIGWLSDGSVQLRHPQHPLWMDDEED